MFFQFIFVIGSVLHFYLCWRASTVPVIAHRLSRRNLFLIAFALWVIYVAGQAYEHSDGKPLALLVEPFAANWTGILFLCFLPMLAVDVVTAFGYLLPKIAPSLRGLALVAGTALSVIALVQGMRPPVVRDYELVLPGMPPERDGTVIVVASDFHLGSLIGKEWLAARVKQINALRPNLIILAGDIVEGHGGNAGEFLPVLRQFSAPLGVWAVTGNHEGYGRSGGRTRILEDAGFRVLHDQWAEVPGHSARLVTAPLVIAGVDDLTSRRHRFGQIDQFVDKALAGRPPRAATIFVSHTPWLADRVAASQVGLMLAAHTHNGQIWPFNYLSRISYPLQGGRYEVGGMPVIVCRGTGTWGPRMRLWYPGEILRITLRTKTSEATVGTRPGSTASSEVAP